MAAATITRNAWTNDDHTGVIRRPAYDNTGHYWGGTVPTGGGTAYGSGTNTVPPASGLVVLGQPYEISHGPVYGIPADDGTVLDQAAIERLLRGFGATIAERTIMPPAAEPAPYVRPRRAIRLGPERPGEP